MNSLVKDIPKVAASINYSADIGEPLHIYYCKPPEGQPYTNIVDDPHMVEIADVRGLASPLTIANEGISFLDQPSRFTAFEDEARVRREYVPELAEIVRGVTGAERVLYMNHALRNPEHGVPASDGAPVEGLRRRPLQRVHGDVTESSAISNIRAAAGAEADDLLQMRYRFFNFWRPIRGPLTENPLAVCDATSMRASDLAPIHLMVENGESSIFSYRYNPEHRWFYMSNMDVHEGVLFSSFDSELPVHKGVVAHTAFEDPSHSAEGLPRYSFEMRLIAFG